MSKKTQVKQAQKKQHLKKNLIIIISVAVVLVAIAAVAYGVYAKKYNNRNYAAEMSAEEVYQYNYMLTVFGRNANRIGSQDVLVIETMTKELGGDTLITFHIFHYTKEADLEDALKMDLTQISADPRFECVGDGTVTMIDDKIAGMSNMQTTYVK